MDFGWILLGFIGIAIVSAFLHVVTRMASERESVGRRKRARESSHSRASESPYSGDTVTYAGHS